MDEILSYWPHALAFVVVVFYFFAGLHIVDQWERKPVKRFGKYVTTLGPGITWLEPFSSRVIDTVDIRDQVDNIYEWLKIKPTSIQTHDNVPITFEGLLTYHIDPEKAHIFLMSVEDGYKALWERSLTIISEFISNTELDNILHNRTPLYALIKAKLQENVAMWGIQIIALELKDVSISDDSIQEAIAMKARAQKEADAELARAKMQKQIAEQLKEAGDAYDANAWKLKGMETMLELCRSAQNNTIVIPTDIIQGIASVFFAPTNPGRCQTPF